jgi:hypothetical protein
MCTRAHLVCAMFHMCSARRADSSNRCVDVRTAFAYVRRLPLFCIQVLPAWRHRVHQCQSLSLCCSVSPASLPHHRTKPEKREHWNPACINQLLTGSDLCTGAAIALLSLQTLQASLRQSHALRLSPTFSLHCLPMPFHSLLSLEP